MAGSDQQPDGCLTGDERRAIIAAWRDLQQTLPAVDELMRDTDVDCSALYDAFQRLEAAFDGFEREVMRAQQIRLLQAMQERPATE